MLMHCVRFYLKPGVGEAGHVMMREGLRSLRDIPEVRDLHVGVPAPVPPRPVVDSDYTYALTIRFADVAAHNSYLDHPIHQAFLEKCRGLWDRTAVYDAEG